MGVYDELVARLERAEARNAELEGEMRFLRDLIANPHLSSSQKITLLAVRTLLKHTGVGYFTEIEMNELGKQIGASRQTAGDNVMTLAKMGALARREHTEVVEGRYGRKVYKTRVSVALTMFTERPAMLRPLEARNHGGKREKRCPHCQSKDLLLYKQLWCACCKREIDSTMEPVNDDRTMDEFVDDVLKRDRERGEA